MNSPRVTLQEAPDVLTARRNRDSELADELLQALTVQAKSMGFSEFEPPSWEEAQFRLEPDPSDGAVALVALWYHAKGQRLGEVTIRDDGQCYAECDILRPHPGKPRWFVECVAVWGSSGKLKGDPRLLPAL